MIIRIKNLRLRTIIGINEWERKTLQDVVINVEITFNGQNAARTDRIEDTVNYKKITKMIIAGVEKADYYLLEKLADHILEMVMKDKRATKVTVEVAEDSNGLNAFYAPHSLSRFTIPRIPDIPDIPRIPSIGHFLHDYNDDHDYFDNDEYEEAVEDYRDELKNMKRELKEMKRELGEIKSKLE